MGFHDSINGSTIKCFGLEGVVLLAVNPLTVWLGGTQGLAIFSLVSVAMILTLLLFLCVACVISYTSIVLCILGFEIVFNPYGSMKSFVSRLHLAGSQILDDGHLIHGFEILFNPYGLMKCFVSRLHLGAGSQILDDGHLI
jgi:hypothetical protein